MQLTHLFRWDLLTRSAVKTRIIWTKFWNDDKVVGLDETTKLIFIYYFTNELIGLTGIYEITDRRVVFDTGIVLDKLKSCKKKLQKMNRIFFHDNWVYVVNAQKLGGYYGEKLNPALLKEIDRIPIKVYRYFTNTLSIPYRYTMDTIRNHKSEIIDNKSEDIKHKKSKYEEFKNNYGGMK